MSNRPSSLADYLAILRRHWWVVAIPLVVAPIGAFVAANLESPVYRANASVYINRTPATATATGVYDQSAATDPQRFFQTQADLARDPVLLNRVARAARSTGMSVGAIAGSSSVAPSGNSDFLIFSVEDGDPDVAVKVVNAYARQFTRYQPEQTIAALSSALKTVQQKLAALKAQGVTGGSAVYDGLVTRESQLATALALQSGNAPQVVQPAGGASKIRPRPQRNALLGLALGAILGIGLAFLREALDRRVWSEEAIEGILALPLLGRIPRPPRDLRRRNELVMIADPGSAAAESFRKLRTNFDFANLDHRHQTVMVSSSVEQEGKSTTVANLAVALARAGRKVAIVDLDLRRPLLHRFFRIGAVPGITDVVAGRSTLKEARREIVLGEGRSELLVRQVAGVNGSAAHRAATVTLLPAGSVRSDPGEFILDEGLYAVLTELRKEFDVILIDAPPMSAVGDALSLSAGVDGIIVVAKLGVVHAGMLHELSRMLEASPTAKLGFIVSGAEHGPVYGYGYGYGHPAVRGREAELARYDEPVS